MNIGLYIDDLENVELLKALSDFTNENIDSRDIEDISIFFNNIAFNPFKTKCGMFNSSELWSFSGNLITTSFNCITTAVKVVNNIKIFYYYGIENKPQALRLIELCKHNIYVVCKSEKDKKEFYRLTGKNPIKVCENFNNVLNTIRELEDGCKSNPNNVYKTA